ncbi:universal stress protein [Vampirovibrio chlorellavorus]|uniref:universal stress protein n=1 Tax=Vampirovibrio chlorellavorus TaxID=758823 RepID=UPI0026EBEE18|nr:universal stress protein [Vampirovibrio chlorellavorus]
MKILLPIDGSDCSTRTLYWAAQTFSKTNTQYYLLYVVPVNYNEVSLVEYEIPGVQEALKTARELLTSLGCQVEKAIFLEGDPISLICDYAEDIEADQVLLGSHGRTGFTKLLLGSVSIAVMEKCQRPVTIHRNFEPVPAKLPQMLKSGTIL